MTGSALNGSINHWTNARPFMSTTQRLGYCMFGERGRILLLLLSRSTVVLFLLNSSEYSKFPIQPPSFFWTTHFGRANRTSILRKPRGFRQKWPLLVVTVYPFTPSSEYSKYLKNLAGGTCKSHSVHLN